MKGSPMSSGVFARASGVCCCVGATDSPHGVRRGGGDRFGPGPLPGVHLWPLLWPLPLLLLLWCVSSVHRRRALVGPRIHLSEGLFAVGASRSPAATRSRPVLNL